MIPARWVIVDRLPLSHNGKVDRGALSRLKPPSLACGSLGPEAACCEPPVNDIERRLIQIWEQSFQRSPIGVEETFFDLGGDSLLAVEIFIQIEEEFGERMAFDSLLEAPTIRSVARLLASQAKTSPMLVTLRANGSRPPLFCAPGISGSLLQLQELTECLGPDQPVYGLRPRGTDGRQPPHTTIEDWAAANIALMRSIQPVGPYCIAGFSLGGVVAFEMARQLEAAGQTIGLVALIDSQLMTHHANLPLAKRLQLHAWKLWHNDDGGRWRYLVTRGRLLVARIRRWNLRRQPEDLVLGLDCPQHVRQMARIHFAALQEYEPGIFRGNITLFTAAIRWDQPDTPTIDPTLGWSQWLEGILDIHELPTTHTLILTRPHVDRLARTIETHLDRVAATPILRRDPIPFEAAPLV
jgi:thioesterase domain-containing protein/acyl carrier protein